MSEIKFSIVTTAEYADGLTKGRWIDATIGAEAIEREIESYLAEKGDDSCVIVDYTGFGHWNATEEDSIEFLSDLAKAIQEYGIIISLIVLQLQCDVEQAVEYQTNCYEGAFSSMEDWAEASLRDSGELDNVSDELKDFINFEEYADHAVCSGRITTIHDGRDFHVYSTR